MLDYAVGTNISCADPYQEYCVATATVLKCPRKGQSEVQGDVNIINVNGLEVYCANYVHVYSVHHIRLINMLMTQLVHHIRLRPEKIIELFLRPLFLKTDAAGPVFIFIQQNKRCGNFYRNSHFLKVVLVRLFQRILFKSGHKT